MHRATLCLVVLLFLCSAGKLNADLINPAVEYASATTLTDTRAFTLGYTFTTSVALTVNALGYWDDGLGNNHLVGLWDSSGKLITSTTVLANDPVTSNFRYQSITNLALAPGTYTIGGEFLGSVNGNPFPYMATGIVTIPGFTWVGDEQNLGSGLNYPTYNTGGTYGQNGILLADFSVASSAVVPEPSTLAIASLCGAFLLGYSRFRRRTAA